MATARTVAKRTVVQSEVLRRLEGDTSREGDREGGGLALATLFQSMFEEVLDHGSASTEQFVQIAHRTHQFKNERIRYIWRQFAGDPFARMVDDVLAVVVVGGWLQDAGGNLWHLGPEFEVNRTLQVTPKTAVLIRPVDLREQLLAYVKQRDSLSALMARLNWRAGQPLRPLDPDRVAELADSMRIFGFMPMYPIVLDYQDHVLSGWHRIAACEQVGIDWTPHTFRYNAATDYERLAIAWYGNDVLPWSPQVLKQLGKLVNDGRPLNLEAIHHQYTQESKRGRVEAELFLDAKRTDRAIAELTGVSQPTVGQVRAELESNDKIYHYTERVEASGRRARGRKPPAEPTFTDEQKRWIIHSYFEDGQSKKDIMKRLGRTGTGHSSSALDRVIATEQGRREQSASATTVPTAAQSSKAAAPTCDHHHRRELCLDCGLVLNEQ
jgi:hypothetical protein